MDRLLVIGAPGIGKTEVIYQLSQLRAKELSREFIDVRKISNIPDAVDMIISEPKRYYLYLRIIAPHVFPEDLQYPKPHSNNHSYVEHYLPKALYLFTLEDVAGTLFIDELTNVQRNDQIAMYYSLILEKEFGLSARLSDQIYVVAAGNPPEWSSVAGGLPAPLINRMVKKEVDPPKPEEWAVYMRHRYGNLWLKETAAFLMANPGTMLKKPSDTETLEAFPTPRSWTRLALEPRDRAIKYADGIIGEEVASRFIVFIKKRPPKPEELYEKPAILREISDVETRYLAIISVAEREDLLTQGRKLIQWLIENDRELFMLLIAITDRSTKINIISEYTDQISDIVDQLAPYISSLS